MTAAAGALNSFLLSNGLDVAAKAGALHEAMRPTVTRCWRTGNQRLKEALHTYASIQLRLGDIQVGRCRCPFGLFSKVLGKFRFFILTLLWSVLMMSVWRSCRAMIWSSWTSWLRRMSSACTSSGEWYDHIEFAATAWHACIFRTVLMPHAFMRSLAHILQRQRSV